MCVSLCLSFSQLSRQTDVFIMLCWLFSLSISLFSTLFCFLGLIYKLGLRKYGIMEGSGSRTQPSNNPQSSKRSPSVFLSFSFPLALSLSLSLSFSLSHTHTLSLSFSHIFQYFSFSHTYSFSHSFSISLSHTRTLSLSLHGPNSSIVGP